MSDVAIIWLLGALACFAVSLAALPEARLAARVIGQFFLTIALPILLIAGILLALLRPLAPDVDPRVSQALIVGTVVAVGWLTTAIFAELAKRRERSERRRDYHRAIYAEIGNNLATLESAEAIDAYAEGLMGRMRADPAFVPFIPQEHNDHVYNAIIDRIEVLPRQTIDAIVAYYSQIKSISTLVQDMRGAAFKRLEQDRRIAMYSDYVAMKKQALAFGTYATNLIRAFEDGGARAAEAVAASVSSRAEARSGRSRGSE